jgi:hypothetical protein
MRFRWVTMIKLLCCYLFFGGPMQVHAYCVMMFFFLINLEKKLFRVVSCC